MLLRLRSDLNFLPARTKPDGGTSTRCTISLVPSDTRTYTSPTSHAQSSWRMRLGIMLFSAGDRLVATADQPSGHRLCPGGDQLSACTGRV